MDRSLFHIGDEYRICACGEWVPAGKKTCDACRLQMKGAIHYIKAEDFGAADAEEPAAVADDVTLICRECNLRFTGGMTECPECGGILWPDDGAAEETEPDSINANDSEESQASPGRFVFEAYRFENGKEIKANTAEFPIDEKVTLGRSMLYSDERYFFRNLSVQEKEHISDFYRTISREHCFLIPERGRLYIELAKEGATVRINGEKIRDTKRREIHDTDEVVIGTREDIDRKIKLVIKKIRTQETGQLTIDRDWVREVVDDSVRRTVQAESATLREALIQEMKKELASYQSALKAEDVLRRSDETSDEAYSRISQVEELAEADQDEAQETVLSKEELIKRFLRVPVSDTQTRDYSGEYFAIRSRKQLVRDLKTAADVECALLKLEDHDEDFYIAVFAIGKFFESCIMTYLVDILHTVGGKEFQDELLKLKENKKFFGMGAAVRFLLDKKRGDERIKTVLRGLKLEDSATRVAAFRAMTKELSAAADIRNTAGHSKESKTSTDKNEHDKAMKENTEVVVSFEELIEAKRACFGHNTLQELHSYWKRLGKEE